MEYNASVVCPLPDGNPKTELHISTIVFSQIVLIALDISIGVVTLFSMWKIYVFDRRRKITFIYYLLIMGILFTRLLYSGIMLATFQLEYKERQDKPADSNRTFCSIRAVATVGLNFLKCLFACLFCFELFVLFRPARKSIKLSPTLLHRGRRLGRYQTIIVWATATYLVLIGTIPGFGYSKAWKCELKGTKFEYHTRTKSCELHSSPRDIWIMPVYILTSLFCGLCCAAIAWGFFRPTKSRNKRYERFYKTGAGALLRKLIAFVVVVLLISDVPGLVNSRWCSKDVRYFLMVVKSIPSTWVTLYMLYFSKDMRELWFCCFYNNKTYGESSEGISELEEGGPAQSLSASLVNVRQGPPDVALEYSPPVVQEAAMDDSAASNDIQYDAEEK